MRQRSRNGLVISAIAVIGLVAMAFAAEMPFGGDKDVAFGNKLWAEMGDYTDWPMKSDVYEGRSPHGKFLRMYYNVVNVDGKPYHVIVKDNFGGPDMATVTANPSEYLGAVTVMVQREDGYDPDNNDWYYVKYKADGSIEKNPEGVALAGRVGKGAEKGCVPCHNQAKDDDFLFSNDR